MNQNDRKELSLVKESLEELEPMLDRATSRREANKVYMELKEYVERIMPKKTLPYVQDGRMIRYSYRDELMRALQSVKQLEGIDTKLLATKIRPIIRKAGETLLRLGEEREVTRHIVGSYARLGNVVP